GHRVLGQYDMFLPPDDDGLIYFVGANVAGVERKFRFPARQFRLWISLHEVTHRLQFGEAPWLRGYLTGLMDSYLDSVEIDPGWRRPSRRRSGSTSRFASTTWARGSYRRWSSGWAWTGSTGCGQARPASRPWTRSGAPKTGWPASTRRRRENPGVAPALPRP